MEQAPTTKLTVIRIALRPVGGLIALILLGCAATSATEHPKSSTGLPPFSAIDAQLFDHAITPEAFGIVVAATDDKLEKRARGAEGILPMRITTVSRDSNGDKDSYELQLVPVAPPLKGPPPSGPMVLTVDSWSPSYSSLQTLESRLVGTPVLLFYRRYQDAEGVALHWHAEADTPRVRASIENAKVLAEISP